MRMLLALGLALLAAHLEAAVTVHATTTASLLNERATAWAGEGCVETGGPFNYEFLATTTTAPAAGTSDSTTFTATAPPCWFQRTTGNTYLAFITPPLSAGFTISGNISAVCSGLESNANENCGCTINLYKWDGRRGGIIGAAFWSGNVTSEYGTSCATRAIGAAAPTSTAVVAGDRIVIVPKAFAIATSTPGSWGGNGARTCGVCFNGAAAGANELSVTFTETLTFSADSAALKVEQVQ